MPGFPVPPLRGSDFLSSLGKPLLSVSLWAPYSSPALPGALDAKRSGRAALGVMLVNPKALLGASFQMTFLSVFIIAAIGAPLLERISQPYVKGMRFLDSPDLDRTLPPPVAPFRLGLRMIAERLSRFLGERGPLRLLAGMMTVGLSTFEVLFISALMQLGLASPMAYYFHRATVIGLPANAVAVPVTGVLMPARVAALALGYVWMPLAKIPAAVTAVCLAYDYRRGALAWRLSHRGSSGGDPGKRNHWFWPDAAEFRPP